MDGDVPTSFSGSCCPPFPAPPLRPSAIGWSDLVCGSILCWFRRCMREKDPKPAERRAARKKMLRLLVTRPDVPLGCLTACRFIDKDAQIYSTADISASESMRHVFLSLTPHCPFHSARGGESARSLACEKAPGAAPRATQHDEATRGAPAQRGASGSFIDAHPTGREEDSLLSVGSFRSDR